MNLVTLMNKNSEPKSALMTLPTCGRMSVRLFNCSAEKLISVLLLLNRMDELPTTIIPFGAFVFKVRSWPMWKNIGREEFIAQAPHL